ncbi:MAG: hypothetical protein ACX939_12585 [Hyphococcus sp.]
MADNLKKQARTATGIPENRDEASPRALQTVSDILLFIVFLACATIALAALAIAAPLAIAVSAVAGLFNWKRAAKTWRPAGA